MEFDSIETLISDISKGYKEEHDKLNSLRDLVKRFLFEVDKHHWRQTSSQWDIIDEMRKFISNS